ncbi:MAG: tRNA-dihydrouridine synthase family protein [Firmicutes bacterium]|uniref:tRNA-dihydrouridine synthase n=1 Tax=Candidatus Scybalomonas excrementavium TaxID=2840943 RepID=A0A9D9HYX6_9FIRM|nr:tRNA-dihydrouridine synthase family protein [Candidatus Scybalomonas excrementavium]
MNYYLAPLEGVTGYVYRNAYHEVFHNIDKYFTPFLSPTQHNKLTSREKNDVIPEHNQRMYVVPQILTNQYEYFLNTVKQLQAFGYEEVNLNLGCPSKTVVTKKKGAGFLQDPKQLEQFLDEIFEKSPISISIKTRIGMESPEEFPVLMKIFNQYPVKELIIHPRVQTDYYKNMPHLETYAYAKEVATMPLCYNGDIFSVEDFNRYQQQFPDQTSWMLGRGIIGNPALLGQIINGTLPNKEELKRFHDKIYEGYEETISGEKNLLFKMKEIWFYMGNLFVDSQKAMKQIKKATKAIQYRATVERLFLEHELSI